MWTFEKVKGGFGIPQVLRFLGYDKCGAVIISVVMNECSQHSPTGTTGILIITYSSRAKVHTNIPPISHFHFSFLFIHFHITLIRYQPGLFCEPISIFDLSLAYLQSEALNRKEVNLSKTIDFKLPTQWRWTIIPCLASGVTLPNRRLKGPIDG